MQRTLSQDKVLFIMYNVSGIGSIQSIVNDNFAITRELARNTYVHNSFLGNNLLVIYK